MQIQQKVHLYMLDKRTLFKFSYFIFKLLIYNKIKYLKYIFI